MIKSEMKTITPEIAEKMIMHNNENRNIRHALVKKYAVAMKKGEWIETHQGIAFDTNGNLIDGQHRLLAIIASGCAVNILVTNNIIPEAYNKLDVGAKRNVADSLRVNRNIGKVISFLCNIAYGRGKATIDETKRVLDVFGDTIETVRNAKKMQVKVFSTAQSMAAATLMIEGLYGYRNEKYVLGLYSDLVGTLIDVLPPIGLAILRQSIQGNASSRKPFDLFARMICVYDRRNNNLSKIQLGEARQDAILLDAKKFILAKLVK